MASTLSFSDQRPLVVATAGHVNHGKSTLVERLTGTNPDRLPEEKKRGMTLDLGFAHCPQVSFVDCPGHEGLIRHFISGQSRVDGALFIVAANEGLQEQSLEHARTLNWLRVQQVLVVVTKTDLVSEEALGNIEKKIMGGLLQIFSSSTDLQIHRTSKGALPEILVSQIQKFFTPKTIAKNNFDRFFVDRAFSLQGVGTILTGTLGEGRIEKGLTYFLWTPGRLKMRKLHVKAIRRDKSQFDFCGELSRVALAVDGVKPAEVKRGACLLLNNKEPLLSKEFVISIDWALKVKKQFSALIQVGTLTQEVSLRLNPLGVWRMTSIIPLPLRRHDRLVVRSPNRVRGMGHVIGGGEILDVNPPPGKLESQPPVSDESFISWCKVQKNPPTSVDLWASRLGWDQERVKKLLVSHQSTRALAEPSQPIDLDKDLLQLILNGKWKATVSPEKKNHAHQLVKAGLIYTVRDLHFLHGEHYGSLVGWLNEHFEKKETLNVDDAREFFKTGRKNFLEILEFCDRLHFTYRKGESRQKLRLPPYSRPAAFPPSSEHEYEKRSDTPLY